MSRHAFSMVPHGDVLARCADLDGDEIALFMIAFFLMLERRGPIADDMAWLGRRSGISTRRANQIRAKLIDQGKWRVRGDQLADPEAVKIIETHVKRSTVNRSNAMERWHKAEQPEFDLNGRSDGKERQKSANSGHATASPDGRSEAEMRNGGKSGEKPEINGGKNEDKDRLIRPETAENRQSGHESRIADSRARAPTRIHNQIDIPSSESSEPRATLGLEPDLLDLLEAVCDASGWRTTEPNRIAEAMSFVKAWRDDGLDFENVVLPTIRSITAGTNDPTSSLKRFDRRVRLEDAKARAAGTAKATYRAPAAPIFEFEGEAPIFVAFRRDLAAALGASTYCSLAHDVRMDQVDDRSIVRIEGRLANNLKSGDCMTKLRQVARKHGFEQVW
jgi:hypothetical protein